jgi:hypothetical protein
MLSSVYASSVAFSRQLLTVGCTLPWYKSVIFTRFLAVCLLLVFCVLVGSEDSSAQVPCELNYYPHDAELDWNGQIPGDSTSYNRTEVSAYVPNCVGIKIKKGDVWVLWYQEKDGPRHSAFPAGTTLTQSTFANAHSGSLLKEFAEYRRRFISFICGQCSEKRLVGAKAPSDSVGELLHSVFSSVLIIPEHRTTEVPFRASELRDMRTLKILSTEEPRQFVERVSFGQDKILRIPPVALELGKTYVWEAEIGETDSVQLYKGSFQVADDSLLQKILNDLDKMRQASQGQVSTRQEAAFYFKHGFAGNATIALLQEVSESAEGR